MLSAIQRKSVATRLVYFRKTVLATRSLKVESIQPCSSSLLSPPRKPCLQDFSPITTRRSNLVIPAKSIIIATDSIINALYNTAEKYGLTNEHIDLLATEAGHTTLDRTQEKQKLKDVIKNQNSNGVSIVYIVGEPEVGKTQLVREYAEKDYPGWIAVTGRTVLTLDMTEFLSSYHQVATKLDINTDFGNGQEMDLGKIAKEMKKKLLKRGTWLLIIDNYNSKDFEYIDEGTAECNCIISRTGDLVVNPLRMRSRVTVVVLCVCLCVCVCYHSSCSRVDLCCPSVVPTESARYFEGF